MVGDRLLTDVMMAHNAGIDSALVLTGDSQLADVLACPVGSRPTFILDQIDGLLPRPVANSA
jgi:ribonucleotide monophosphatase NagD (HAD superfamily)